MKETPAGWIYYVADVWSNMKLHCNFLPVINSLNVTVGLLTEKLMIVYPACK